MHNVPTILGSLWVILRSRLTSSSKPTSELRVGIVGNVPEPTGGAEIFLQNLVCHLEPDVESIAIARWWKQKFHYSGATIRRTYREKPVIESNTAGTLKTFYLFRPTDYWFPRPFQILALGIKTAGFFLRERCNVIHCHLLDPNIYFAYIAARLIDVPVVVTVHGLVDLNAIRFPDRQWRWQIKAYALRYVLRRCDRVIAVSAEIRKQCLDLSISNTETKCCGIDTEFFTPKTSFERGILFVGTLADAKGLDVLLKAYQTSRETHSEPLLLAGKNPDGLTFPGESGVIYLGELTPEALRDKIRHSKLVVLPSRSEGLPLSILEAMACNKLVLVTAVGELTSVVVDSDNGFLLKNLDAVELSQRISEILTNYEQWTTVVGKKPRATVERYDIRCVAAWHRRLYLNLVSIHREHRPNGERPQSSIRRTVILPALVRLDSIPSFAVVFRWTFQLAAKLAARTLRLPGVQFVFLRRGLAKNEFMPFLSDIDMTVITVGEEARVRAANSLNRLARYLPMLEKQNEVLTSREFDSWSDQQRFTANRTFLYRLVEAKNSWVSLFDDGSQNPLERVRKLSRAETIATVRSEILFWYRIVCLEFSARTLANVQPANAFHRKRSAWIMMKATSELWNFRQALCDYQSLLFTRREIIYSAKRQFDCSRWDDFFAAGEALLDNRLGLDGLARYVRQADEFLSELYLEYHDTMTAMIENDRPLMNELHRIYDQDPGMTKREWVGLDLLELKDLSQETDDSVVAVFVSARPVDRPQFKVGVLIVIDSLASPPLSQIDSVRREIFRGLVSQGVTLAEIDTVLVDYAGYQCFGAFDAVAPNARLLVDRRQSQGDTLCGRLVKGFVNKTDPLVGHTVRSVAQ